MRTSERERERERERAAAALAVSAYASEGKRSRDTKTTPPDADALLNLNCLLRRLGAHVRRGLHAEAEQHGAERRSALYIRFTRGANERVDDLHGRRENALRIVGAIDSPPPPSATALRRRRDRDFEGRERRDHRLNSSERAVAICAEDDWHFERR